MTDTSPEPVKRPATTRSRRSDNVREIQEGAQSPTGPPKKKRKTAKPNPDKKFDCKHPDCGKSYSRAEHLYRHQLNHTPKQIYRCDFPGCNRYFVRQDLCVRHRERHTTQGSQLQKRDSFTQSSSKPDLIADDASNPKHDIETAISSAGCNGTPPDKAFHSVDDGTVQPTRRHSRLPHSNQSPTSNETDYYFSRPKIPDNTHLPLSYRGNGVEPSFGTGGDFNPRVWAQPHQPREFDLDARHRFAPRGVRTHSSHSPVNTFTDHDLSSNSGYGHKTRLDAYPRTGDYHDVVQDHGPLSPTELANTLQSPRMVQPQYMHSHYKAFSTGIEHSFTSDHSDSFNFAPLNSFSMADVGSAYGYPIFGGEEFKHSPVALGDDFTAWFFNNDPGSGPTGFSPNDTISNFALNSVIPSQMPHLLRSPTSLMNSRHNDSLLTNPMDLTNVLAQSNPGNHVISEDKRQELLDMIQMLFIDRPHDAVKKRKDSIFEGDIDAPGHILSLPMMHNYIGSYWYHQHAQLPILHRPTFSADTTPNLLLLAIIAIGAATLDKVHGEGLTDSAAEFANFLTWHIRWEIIRDCDFRPPARLWVFQTLLLVEVYEKMYSTRALHERAHIHHDSTLTLMRRGSSLTGKPATSTPSNGQEDGIRADNVNGSQASWERWIDGEATRRVAFAAFVIDSIHCTMFGHSAKMVAHEMRLPLPCDEGLWSASTPSEASRVNSLLMVKGTKQLMFLDSLRKTLRGEKVHTNTFGRTIIMAGLLSVSYHMNQRDIQMLSLGQNRGTFGLDKSWKSLLLRAYDNWKKDFDESLDNAGVDIQSPPHRSNNRTDMFHMHRPLEDEAIFESRTVLHHLAHIAAHVDIVACQIFAGANRLLSRSVTPKDYLDIRGKVEKWATKASARDSAFYALKFIAQVLVPQRQIDHEGHVQDGYAFKLASPILPQAFESNKYIARDDFLLNRPWVLYISALVVWCYGFALEGPIKPTPRDEDFQTYGQREADMHDFLDRVAGIEAPDDLEHVTGKNRCLGLLLILEESFESTRWELTHEASRLLGNAALKLKGATGAETTMKRRK